MLPSTTQYHYGLRVKPTFDSEVDAANKPLRIPMPDRSQKKKAFSLYRAALLDMVQGGRDYAPGAPDPMTIEERMAEIQRLAAAHDLAGLEHELSGDPIPTRVTRVVPSPAADDAVFTQMAEHSQRLFESAQQATIRHRVDTEAQQILEGVRSTSLFNMYQQGRGHSMLQNEIPLDLVTETEQTAVAGHQIQRVIPRTAPIQPPIAKGHTAPAEFLPFRELNWSTARIHGPVAEPSLAPGNSYESHRRQAISSAQ